MRFTMPRMRGPSVPGAWAPALLCGLACYGCRAASAPLMASWPVAETPGVEDTPAPMPALTLSGEAAPVSAGIPNSWPGDALQKADEGYEWKRFGLSIGAQLIADMNTTLRVDSSTLGVGTEVDLESDFDVDDSLFLGRIDADWRFAKRHALDFSIFDLQRQGTRVIDRDIQIGDVVFPVNSRVTNEFEQLIVKLAYRYSFLNRQRWHVGASVGAHTMNWSTEWRTGALALEENFDLLVPLPVLGLFGSYALTPKLYLSASSEFFGLEYEEFDGFLNNTRLNLEHRTFEHIGFGIGLDYFLINASVESESGNLQAEAEYDYIGLLGFVRIF